jgi:hypothetical protein
VKGKELFANPCLLFYWPFIGKMTILHSPPARVVYSRMKKGLRIAALVLALAGVGYWYAAGHHTGWSQNQVPVKKLDPVTDQEFTEYERRFVPGIEVLGGVLAVSAVLFVVSLVVKKK